MSAQDREQAEAVKLRYEFHLYVIRRVRPMLLWSICLNLVFAVAIFAVFFTHPERRYFASVLTGEVVALSPLPRAGD